MSAAIRENELLIRACILYESLDDKPIAESYKNFCRKVGKDIMTLHDFDYWFYRFHNGNHDLYHDRSKDPKPKSLSDFPIGVMYDVLGHVDPFERLVLRKVSRNLRDVVQKMRCELDALYVNKENTCISIGFGQGTITYSQVDNGCQVDQWKSSSGYKKKFVEGGDFMELFNTDFRTLLENKKVILNSFDVHHYLLARNGTNEEQFLDHLIEIIKSSNKFTTRSFGIGDLSFDKIARFLELMEPKSLEKLEIGNIIGSTDYDHLVNTEQWKTLKHFISECVEISIPIDHLLHFTTMKVDLTELTVHDALKIRDMLDTSETFDYAMIYVKMTDPIEVARVFNPEYNNDDNQNRLFYYTNPGNKKFAIGSSKSMLSISDLASDYFAD